jgi:CubicO group peptidase (beta-lactamase class C family)
MHLHRRIFLNSAAGLLVLLAIQIQYGCAARAQGAVPVFSNTGHAAEAYGASNGYPVPPAIIPLDKLTLDLMVGYYSHYDLLRPLRAVPTSPGPIALKRAAAEIAPVYGYDGRIKTLADYLDAHPVTGLLIARDDTILYEHYRYGRTDRDRFMSQSMAKTVVAMLIGIAIEEKAIKSIDDPASVYAADLAGTEFGATPIKALLQMSSGIAYRETYLPDDDVYKLGYALFAPDSKGPIAAVAQFNTRAAPPGIRFNYSSADTEVLGLVLSRAVKMPIAEYLSVKIWSRLGAEADAAWDIDPSGQEVAYCCMVATLRDWARFALMLANDGAWNGQQLVPRQWVIDATSAATDSRLAPGRLSPILGYGYQTWISAGERRRFSMIGIHGQNILVDPVTKIVLVHTAVRPNAAPSSSGVELSALWYAVLAQYGQR